MVQNVRYLNGQSSHVTLPIVSGIWMFVTQMVTVFSEQFPHSSRRSWRPRGRKRTPIHDCFTVSTTTTTKWNRYYMTPGPGAYSTKLSFKVMVAFSTKESGARIRVNSTKIQRLLYWITWIFCLLKLPLIEKGSENGYPLLLIYTV